MPQFEFETFFIQGLTCLIFLIVYFYYSLKRPFLYFLEIQKYRIKKFNSSFITFFFMKINLNNMHINNNFKNYYKYYY